MQGASREWWQQILYNQILNETPRRIRLYNTKSSIYKWNQKLIKTQLDSRVFDLWNRKTFVEQKNWDQDD